MLAVFGTPSGGELLLVMLVVLLLFGAKNLPRMARTLGRTMEEFRRAAREVTDEIVHADDDDLQKPRRLPMHGKQSQSTGSDSRESPAADAVPAETSKVDTAESTEPSRS